jgi:hypothetical protein
MGRVPRSLIGEQRRVERVGSIALAEPCELSVAPSTCANLGGGGLEEIVVVDTPIVR